MSGDGKHKRERQALQEIHAEIIRLFKGSEVIGRNIAMLIQNKARVDLVISLPPYKESEVTSELSEFEQ